MYSIKYCVHTFSTGTSVAKDKVVLDEFSDEVDCLCSSEIVGCSCSGESVQALLVVARWFGPGMVMDFLEEVNQCSELQILSSFSS